MVVSAVLRLTHRVPMAMEFLDTQVVRGRDWEWGNQGGGEGSVVAVV